MVEGWVMVRKVRENDARGYPVATNDVAAAFVLAVDGSARADRVESR